METFFGFQKVSMKEKASKVHAVFSAVAEQYDLMNDLMSFGIHRIWKKIAVQCCQLRPPHWVLDLAGGTGDLAKQQAQLVTSGQVVLADINNKMLLQGRDNLINSGLVNNIQYLQANAEELPIPEYTFDCVSIAYGLRNIANQAQALREIYRILKPGGRAVILEFSTPIYPWLAEIYDKYSFKVLPWLGEFVAQNKDSYQYLVESIRMHPNQEELTANILAAGFDKCDYQNLAGGISAIHIGIKY